MNSQTPLRDLSSADLVTMGSPVNDLDFVSQQKELWQEFDACGSFPWGWPRVNGGKGEGLDEDLTMVDIDEQTMRITEDFAIIQSPTLTLNSNRGSFASSSTTTGCTTNDADTGSATEMKPRTQRERNRIAAEKCRKKSKVKAEVLKEQCRELSERNRHLLEQARSLQSEVLDLKNELLNQGNCSCELMSGYVLPKFLATVPTSPPSLLASLD
ncbi:uncharacterized protein B0I36DRAFT_385102 [Microdochium trichocladiopsis]|uniref:BZIP domain-containing protein n=1 Tax=Microdochium trichocladiopsis TaxID=1682393 RepID=A0A9P8Y771_9PEZI|nr:uncharacterized protein B0I36DRAFT_385102 [Microdochium trichocladiopsis]KAH7029653.1 hypothetical protein B0I36DRAFT_385102 [Microdochium trichocladiopsis]